MPSHTRSRLLIAGFAVMGFAFLGAACQETPSAPPVATSPARALKVPKVLASAQGLLWQKPLAEAVVVTRTVPSSGGSIDVPGTGFQLQIPSGAFAGQSMTFTVTALPGSIVAYDFAPHGATFLKPLGFVQQLGHTNWKTLSQLPGATLLLEGAYFADAAQLDEVTGHAQVDEFLAADVNVAGATLRFPISHFSGYMTSSGRH